MTHGKPTEIEALKMVGGGVCLGYADGATWMVAGALPGERVLVEEVHRRAGIIEARTTEVLENPHHARLDSPCPHAGPCGGCDWSHIDINLGAPLKADVAAEAARQHQHLSEALRGAPVQTSPPSYRLRARLHWDPATSSLGFFGRQSSAVHPLSDCRVVSPRLLAAVPDISEALARSSASAGDLEWLEDLEGKRAICALRPPPGAAPQETDHLPSQEDLKDAVNGFHLLDESGTVIEGWGPHAVEMTTPVPLSVPVGSFFQGNRHLASWLFRRVAELAGNDSVPTWDLHAGIGFLAAAATWAAPRELVLVEPYGPSARAAADNIADAQVAVGITAENYCNRHTNLPQKALVITDPPRIGMSRGLRRQLSRWLPNRILMLACDPATWTRDTAYLLEHGYRLTHLELVDLFPSTHHVEILALLERQ